LALVFAGFKWGFPSCLRGPLGLSPTLLWVPACRRGSSQLSAMTATTRTAEHGGAAPPTGRPSSPRRPPGSSHAASAFFRACSHGRPWLSPRKRPPAASAAEPTHAAGGEARLHSRRRPPRWSPPTRPATKLPWRTSPRWRWGERRKKRE
jgi:hypothetical protein